MASDFTEAELKRAYKTMSKKSHPDRNGGSNTMFQRVASAYETLRDPAKRRLYDLGDEVKREIKRDGSEGAAFEEVTEREYFPERFGFEPFGDPFERKRDVMEQRRKTAPLEPNAADCPAGSYQGSCHGCSVYSDASGRPTLKCKQCLDPHRDRIESEIAVGGCSDEEEIGNNHGKLWCEPKPTPCEPNPCAAEEECVQTGRETYECGPPPGELPGEQEEGGYDKSEL
eukprot:COSAG05_NODE_553_length_8711_cov_165.199257_4_plen_228_part_00